MVRYLLSILIISISASLFSQNLKLTYNDEDVSNGEITVEGVPTEALIKTVIYITNNAEVDIQVKVKRTSSEVVEGTYNSFCLGSCYPPTTDEAENPFPIAAGATTSKDDFYIEFYPEGTEGESTITFEIWDINNTDTNVSFTITYSIHTPTVISVASKSFSLNAFPNPAITNSVRIGYTNLSDYSSSAITIRNILGIVVAQSKVNGLSGFVDFDLGRIPNGLYLYSVESGGRKLITKKLMINR